MALKRVKWRWINYLKCEARDINWISHYFHIITLKLFCGFGNVDSCRHAFHRSLIKFWRVDQAPDQSRRLQPHGA